MLVPPGALVLALNDGHVALWRNRGGGGTPDLEAVPHDQFRQCGTRVHGSPDDRRVHDVLEALDPLLAGGSPLILIAPPHLLGAVRGQVPKQARRQVVAEIPRDFAGCASHELAAGLHSVRP